MKNALTAGAAVVDITPKEAVFLYGYPHVERYSTGVHDPLLSSAMYLSDGLTEVMFIANDVIFISKATAERIRKRISEATDVPACNIMVTATHTHSGPMTVDYISNEGDAAVPGTDGEYVRFMEDGIVAAAIEAYRSARPAQLGMSIAEATGVGTNRRDPSGPSDPQAPVLVVKSVDGRANIAAMLACSMHPTVLHEDSALISGDFPAMTRQYLQKSVLSENCPVLYHTAPAGDQSPRHVVRGNTFEEARRLGDLLGQAVAKVIASIEYTADLSLGCKCGFVALPRRTFPAVAEAEKNLDLAVRRLERMRQSGEPRGQVRTAECDWFGAEEALALARAAAAGRLDNVAESCMPAEVQVITVGKWALVGWPGEVFVEYALAVKAKCPDTYVISLANGELQGYIVTEQAAAEGGYEASNALFAPAGGQLLVDKTLEMLSE